MHARLSWGAPALAAALLLAAAPPAGAQQDSDDWLERCRRGSTRGERAVHCEVRESRLRAPSVLSVDGRPNGGVTVRAWDGRDVLVRARIQSAAADQARARSLAGGIQVLTDGGRVRAEGPRTERREQWTVSYEVLVPRRQNLELRTMNGGITVENVTGRMEMRALNGGVTLRGLAGDVQARTTNGGVRVELEGSRWNGGGLDVQTTNGGVSLSIPSDYAANLVVGTVNGSLNFDFPVTVQGRIGRRLETALNGGGPPIRATTTNGGVRVRRN
jgi:DUF4097 and DUF4098 domain-containing protein YvlB